MNTPRPYFEYDENGTKKIVVHLQGRVISYTIQILRRKHVPSELWAGGALMVDHDSSTIHAHNIAPRIELGSYYHEIICGFGGSPYCDKETHCVDALEKELAIYGGDVRYIEARMAFFKGMRNYARLRSGGKERKTEEELKFVELQCEMFRSISRLSKQKESIIET